MSGSRRNRVDLRSEKRREAALRLSSRVKKPVSLSDRGRDPMVQSRKPFSRRALEVALYGSFAALLHLGPVVFFWNLNPQEDRQEVTKKSKGRDFVRIVDPGPEVPSKETVVDIPQEPVEERSGPAEKPKVETEKPAKRAVRPSKKRDIPEEVLPADWVDMASKESPADKTPRRRVVGISFESTVSGGGPSFAVGNTRMGETGSEAADPKDIGKLGPASQKAVASTRSAGSNKSATFIPGQRVKFQKPKRLKEVALDYPGALKARGVEGNVVVMIRIGPNGKVEGVRVLKSSGHSELDAAAQKAASLERFSPAKRNGEPVDYDLKYTYRFRIKNT